MDDLVKQAGASHWAARVEALEGLLELLTVAGGDGFGGESKGEGGRFVLESRATSRRLEAVISERVRDAHFRVAAAALSLLGRLVEVHSALMEGHASVLLPSVRELVVLLRFSLCFFSCFFVDMYGWGVSCTRRYCVHWFRRWDDGDRRRLFSSTPSP